MDKHRTVRSRVARTPFVRQLEELWGKRRAGHMEVISKKRDPKTVSVDETRLPGLRSTIHTHSLTGRSPDSRPSYGDYKTFINELTEHGIKTGHIISIDEQGRPVGYFSIHATPRFIENVNRNQRLIQILNELQILQGISPHSKVDVLRKIMVYGKLEHNVLHKLLSGYGLKVTTRSRPGFKFNGKYFEKK